MNVSPPLPLPVLCLCLAAAPLAAIAAMSLDEAQSALNDDAFKVREQAEQVIRRAGLDEYPRVARLTQSDEPEVAFRARACLPVVLLDIDDRMPPELAAKLLHIDDWHDDDLDAIVAAVKELDPPRPVTLIGLANHVKSKQGDDAEGTRSLAVALEQALQAALSGDAALSELNRVRPERYQTKTLALVLNNLCKVRPDDLTPVLALYDDWTRNQPQLAGMLNAEGYRLEVTRAITKAPTRIEALGQLFSFTTGRELSPDQQKAVQKAIDTELRRDDILTDLTQLPIDQYKTETLAMILNGVCRQRQDDLTPVLALYDGWTRSHEKLPGFLNADGYRLELTREANKAPNRGEALGMLLAMGTKGGLSPTQMAALRQQLGTYQNEAGAIPVESLDQATGWFFFNTFGADQLDAYCKFRERFPEIDETTLMDQPLEVLLVLRKSGAGAALDYAMKQRGHGGAMMLGEWLHAHPELIREPLPLPENIAGKPYAYRTVKFFRLFAPYADEAEMNKNPEVAAAYAILAKDPRWTQVAKQAREVMVEQRPMR